MPRIVGPGSSKLLLSLLVLALLFGFTPISRGLLRSVNGSFAPTSYSSLSFRTPSDAEADFPAGKPVPLQLTNRTGHVKTYHWSATQEARLSASAKKPWTMDRSTTILVPSRGAVTGKLQIALTGTGHICYGADSEIVSTKHPETRESIEIPPTLTPRRASSEWPLVRRCTNGPLARGRRGVVRWAGSLSLSTRPIARGLHVPSHPRRNGYVSSTDPPS